MILKPRVEYRFPKYRFLKVSQKLAKISLNRLNTSTAARVNRDCSAKLVEKHIVRSDAMINRITCFKMKSLFYLITRTNGCRFL